MAREGEEGYWDSYIVTICTRYRKAKFKKKYIKKKIRPFHLFLTTDKTSICIASYKKINQFYKIPKQQGQSSFTGAKM